MNRWFNEILVFGLASVLTAMLIIMPGETAAKEKGVLIIGDGTPITNLDPSFSNSRPSSRCTEISFRGYCAISSTPLS